MNWPAFDNPWMLAGLAAIGLPVLIHFLTRARPRRIAFPPFKFLVEACAGQQAIHRLRTINLSGFVDNVETVALFDLARPLTIGYWETISQQIDAVAMRDHGGSVEKKRIEHLGIESRPFERRPDHHVDHLIIPRVTQRLLIRAVHEGSAQHPRVELAFHIHSVRGLPFLVHLPAGLVEAFESAAQVSRHPGRKLG